MYLTLLLEYDSVLDSKCVELLYMFMKNLQFNDVLYYIGLVKIKGDINVRKLKYFSIIQN